MAGYKDEGMTDHEENINWDDVGKPIPLGEYDVEVVEAKYKPTSSNKHMCNVQFKILSAYDGDNEDAAVNKMVFENFVFTQSAAFRVKGFSKVSGVELPSVINKTVLEQWANDIVGTQVGVAIVHRVWEGEARASISKFFEFGSGGDAEVEKKKADTGEDEDEDEDEDEEEEKSEVEDTEQEATKVTSIKDAMKNKPETKKTKKSSAR